MYQLYTSFRDDSVCGAIRSNEDGSKTAFLFVDGTPEYVAYLAWLEGGNAPLPPEGAERARNEDGTYKADDPATPGVNEAWVSGSTQ